MDESTRTDWSRGPARPCCSWGISTAGFALGNRRGALGNAGEDDVGTDSPAAGANRGAGGSCPGGLHAARHLHVSRGWMLFNGSRGPQNPLAVALPGKPEAGSAIVFCIRAHAAGPLRCLQPRQSCRVHDLSRGIELSASRPRRLGAENRSLGEEKLYQSWYTAHEAPPGTVITTASHNAELENAKPRIAPLVDAWCNEGGYRRPQLPRSASPLGLPLALC